MASPRDASLIRGGFSRECANRAPECWTETCFSRLQPAVLAEGASDRAPLENALIGVVQKARRQMSDGQDEAFVLPQVYKRHVFACFTQRPPNHPRGSCGASGAQPLWDRLGKLVEADRSGEIGFTAAGCLGFCSAGPLMVVYPDGVWYRPTTPEDIDEIFSSHLKEGLRVDRLVMILTR